MNNRRKSSWPINSIDSYLQGTIYLSMVFSFSWSSFVSVFFDCLGIFMLGRDSYLL